MDDHEEVPDEFNGVKVWWVLNKHTTNLQSFSFYPNPEEKRSFKLSFHKRYRELITGPYIEHVMSEGKAVSMKNRQRKLYYTEIGKAWKRGYLLYGQRVKKKEEDGDEEEKNPIKKKEKEEKENKDSKVTLSGLLNFIDGLWSACGGERIIVFTTNYVDKLDTALIRRGRMDKHIEMSYCCFEAFKVLANNYLDIDSHELYAQIGSLLGETNMTPADVAENLMPKSDEEGVETFLNTLIEALEDAKKEEARKKIEEEVQLKAEKEEKDMEESAQKAVKVNENSAQEAMKVNENSANSVVKENGFDKFCVKNFWEIMKKKVEEDRTD
ncbi:hypothetical protein Ddye_015077 [Dipteronia dyeriana]|uniref:ATPase AAA-type core domain-containing protein n=1 Tax=Dipteronia dyeriana TaxID=168575 RepID=A0AAD9U4X7_9ROSI|nr:hypothetical protein Ddye_015077 [Dipteronia dyeriana]